MREERRCAASHQRELFQRVSEKRPKSAGDYGTRRDRVQYSDIAEVVG